MKYFKITAVLVLSLLATAVLPWRGRAASAPRGFAGDWTTTFGDMTLSADGDAVTGTYLLGDAACRITGRLDKGVLVFTYMEPNASGEGRFRLSPGADSFEGEWRVRGESGWSSWKGRRRRPGAKSVSFDGLWLTSFGRLRLAQSGGRVSGFYEYAGGSYVDGKISGRKLKFRYREEKAAGEGVFELSADRKSFSGRWRKDGAVKWGLWDGTRVEPVPGRNWLVVAEARWEGGLADREYSFGEMLRAFFARSPAVQFRHRFFTDEASLTRWLREASLLAEPTVLLISSHGLPEGVSVSGGVVGPAPIADALRFAHNLRLLHIDACLTMKGPFPRDLLQRLGRDAVFPVSGYTESVDWAASAISDFMYLDLIFSREYSPAQAAGQLGRLLPYTAAAPVVGAPFASLGFRLVEPEPKK